jgi:hypothetical protein
LHRPAQGQVAVAELDGDHELAVVDEHQI